jgi:hypothetical protein
MDKPQDPEAAETAQTTNIPAVDLPQLVRLARECPMEYPPSGKWGDLQCVVIMAEALLAQGFPFLAKAVTHGKGWPWKISLCRDHLQSLVWLEEEAAGKGWTWNRPSLPNAKSAATGSERNDHE